MRGVELFMECYRVRIRLELDLFVRLDNEKQQISIVLRQVPLVIGQHSADS